jgi:hypothetical protein
MVIIHRYQEINLNRAFVSSKKLNMILLVLSDYERVYKYLTSCIHQKIGNLCSTNYHKEYRRSIYGYNQRHKL